MKTIGVVIATQGRPSLLRTMQSISYQGLYRGDDVLVVGDGYSELAEDLVEAFGPPFRYVPTQGVNGNDWGHTQVNYGLKNVGGDVVVIQDDDDIFAPRAFEQIRSLVAEHPNIPIIGRTKTPQLGLLWSEPGPKTLLDGHCLIAPNVKKKLGYFSRDYIGDQCYISTTLQNYPEVNWVDRVWTLTRPSWVLQPRNECDPLDLHQNNFLREFGERLPLVTAHGLRMLEGYRYEGGWMWVFRSASCPVPVGALRMFLHDGCLWATMSYVPGEGQQAVIEEIVEFAAWAGQGQDVWFGTLSNDEEIITELKKKGFEDHIRGPEHSDFVLPWPPKWFPFETLHEIRDKHGNHVADWRDQW